MIMLSRSLEILTEIKRLHRSLGCDFTQAKPETMFARRWRSVCSKARVFLEKTSTARLRSTSRGHLSTSAYLLKPSASSDGDSDVSNKYE